MDSGEVNIGMLPKERIACGHGIPWSKLTQTDSMVALGPEPFLSALGKEATHVSEGPPAAVAEAFRG